MWRLPKYALKRELRLTLSFCRNREKDHGRIPTPDELGVMYGDPDFGILVWGWIYELRNRGLTRNDGVLGEHLTTLGHAVLDDENFPMLEVPA